MMSGPFGGDIGLACIRSMRGSPVGPTILLASAMLKITLDTRCFDTSRYVRAASEMITSNGSAVFSNASAVRSIRRTPELNTLNLPDRAPGVVRTGPASAAISRYSGV